MPNARHLSLDELAPAVDLAGHWLYEQRSWHRYRVPGHHLILVIAGRLDAITPDGRFSASPGDLVSFRPTARNEYGADGALEYFQIHLFFAPPPRHQLTPVLDEVGALPVRLSLGQRLGPMRKLFETVCRHLPRPGAAHRLRVRAACHEILALAAEAAAAAPPVSGDAPDAWQRARRQLESTLAADVRVAALARAMGLSADRFIRGFTRRFGITPKRLRTEARLRLAAQRLRAGDEPIKAIARGLGFADATAFGRLFRRHFGVLPSELRASGDAPDTSPPEPGGLARNRHLVQPDESPDFADRFRV